MAWSLWGSSPAERTQKRAETSSLSNSADATAQVPPGSKGSPFFRGPYRTALWFLLAANIASLYFQLTSAGYGGFLGFALPMGLWFVGMYLAFEVYNYSAA